jgi:rod shape-determining protein MreD
MRPVSHQLLSLFPAILALVLIFLTAAPMAGNGLTYTPNIAWLMTIVMVAYYPESWPRGLAFGFGLLQDVLFGTPLGSQALLTLLLAQLTDIQSMRNQSQLFRLRWLEAAGVLIMMHLLLWAVMHLVNADTASLRNLLRAGLVNALWYPLFYWVATRSFAALPDAK